MSYVALADFKAYRKVNRPTDLEDDVALQAALDAAEGWINLYTGRQFTVASGPATARQFAPTGTARLDIDDATTITSVTDAAGTVPVTDYQLEPINTVGVAGVVEPYNRIRRYFGWWQTFNTGQFTVTVTGTWGWAAIPPQVIEACKIQAKDILANRELNFGIASFEAYGLKARENPQVTGLIRPFRRVRAFGIA